ncbi:HlyD family secretion protein [Chenggangzhangella methanolivorans]|uniref:HlyD family secretion protein n=1 Tax=Chenggangzhangella methanolivorans TaxID=1437009 RepID=UPI00360CFC3B
MAARAANLAMAPEMAAAPPPPPPSGERETSADLFRAEAVEEQRSQWLGSVLVAPGISAVLFAAFAAFAGAGVIALLTFGGHTQKSRVAGWLAPDSGMARVFAPQAGRIVKLHVREGDAVRRGDPLALISTELESAAIGRTHAAAVAELQSRRESLKLERDRQDRLHALQERALGERIPVLVREGERLSDEIALQRSRMAIADDARDRIAGLRSKGFSTEPAVQEAERDRLRIAADLQSLERERLENERERLTAEAQAREAPLARDAKLGEIVRQVSALSQELAEAEGRREAVITAPQDGVVTAVRGALGGGVGAEAPLLSIVPEGSKLVAELFASSRAIGFVREGQTVLLRYQPFPYQKFGLYRGVVTGVSRSAVSPAELPPQLAGLTGLIGADEPVYRIEVAPDRQDVTAYGRPIPLQAGMRLEADIEIERRRLFEWMLDPLYALTGRTPS